MQLSTIGKSGIMLVGLSLFLPWASRWDTISYLFLYGYYTPISGYRTYGTHWFWVLPLSFMILGFALILSGDFVQLPRNKDVSATLRIAGSACILFSAYFFLVWFSPESPKEGIIITLEARASLGYFLAILGAFFTLARAVDDLIVSWSGQQ